MRLKRNGMILGKVIGASGATGFYSRKEYPNQKIFEYIPGYVLKGMYKRTKTATLEKEIGNLRFKEDGITLADRFPDCIYVDFFKRFILNAVGLSNPGIIELLRRGIWQQWSESFIISIAAIKGSTFERAEEISEIAKIIKMHLKEFCGFFAIEINESCPNKKDGQNSSTKEILLHLEIVSSILEDIPLIPKISLLTSPEEARKISEHPACDAISLTNSIPFGAMPEEINWEWLFRPNGSGFVDASGFFSSVECTYWDPEGKTQSPLARYGGGGLSGKPLFNPGCNWLKKAEHVDILKPLIMGAGINNEHDVEILSKFQPMVQAIAPSSAMILSPWNMKSIIDAGNKLFKQVW